MDRIATPTGVITTAPSAEPTAEPAPTEWFWLMTVQTPQQGNGSFAVATRTGTVDVWPGTTREMLYRQVRRYVEHDMGADGVVVLHFSVEPNALDGGAA
ncbi:hypothetical protein ABZX93_35140 [Streptomyces sp. NPDC006632]|uniref:hypothetical protein n=1 Tax=Streptomyces sp. NPDC006632 TaxID=3157182 RepID=UPI00339FDD32